MNELVDGSFKSRNGEGRLIKSKSIIFNYKGSVKDPLDCLSFGDVLLPELGENDVLIEIEASVFNPSDHGGLMASFRNKLTDTVHGNEGVGIVIKGGKSKAAKALIGKRVASLKAQQGTGQNIWCKVRISVLS